MNHTTEMKLVYKNIQQRLFFMIPEKWDSLYLYASIIEKLKKIEIGEMFFYYYPKGVIKKNPINVYEIANKFNIDEEDYSILINKLYEVIKQLRVEFKKNHYKMWTNITIKIENHKFIVEYYYNDLAEIKYTEHERHLIWKCKNLNYPIEKLTKTEKKVFFEYIRTENVLSKDDVYEESLYKMPKLNMIEYNKDTINNKEISNLKIKKTEKKEKFKKNNKNNENEIVAKSQILKI